MVYGQICMCLCQPGISSQSNPIELNFNWTQSMDWVPWVRLSSISERSIEYAGCQRSKFPFGSLCSRHWEFQTAALAQWRWKHGLLLFLVFMYACVYFALFFTSENNISRNNPFVLLLLCHSLWLCHCWCDCVFAYAFAQILLVFKAKQ